MSSVLVIDAHPVLLEGCRRLLEEAGFAPVLGAADIVSGYRLYLRNAPDVVVLDLAMGEQRLAGLSVIRRIRSHNPQARILVFSVHRDPAIAASALDAGASGYLLKDAPVDELARAVTQVQAGARYLDQSIAPQSAALARAGSGGRLAALTGRELQTLTLLSRGESYGRIARQLGVSYKTVVNTSYNLRQKLGARNLPELIRMAVELLSTGI